MIWAPKFMPRAREAAFLEGTISKLPEYIRPFPWRSGAIFQVALTTLGHLKPKSWQLRSSHGVFLLEDDVFLLKRCCCFKHLRPSNTTYINMVHDFFPFNKLEVFFLRRRFPFFLMSIDFCPQCPQVPPRYKDLQGTSNPNNYPPNRPLVICNHI